MSDEPKDWLDDTLREEPRYIDDNGFSARVAADLPQRRAFRWQRTAVLAGTTTLAIVLGLFVLPGGSYVAHSAEALLRAHSLATLPVVPLVLLTALLGGLIAFASSES